MNRVNVPQLRFKEFDGEWELNKLGEMAQFKAGYAFKSQQMLAKKSNYQLLKMSNVYQNELRLDRNPSFWKTIDAKQKEFLLKKGDSILTLTGTVGKKDYGYSMKIEDDNKFLLNQRLVLLREIQNKSDNGFISYLISNEKFLFYFFAEAKGGTGNQTNVSTEDVKNIKLNFPTLPEQQKIASFLSAVDEKIQQLSRKKELLEQYKKGLMQQLFSGKLRFKDENGNDYAEWESVKMNELFSFKQGIQCGVEDQFLEKADNMERFIRIIDLTSETEIPRFINNTDKGNIIFEDDLFMVRYGVPGLIGFGYNGVIANNLFRLIPKKSVHNKFYLYVLTHLKKDIMNLSSSTTMPALNFSSLGVLKIPEIEIKEQQKIANFLSSIDSKIESANYEISQMQSFKKGLLQQMFV